MGLRAEESKRREWQIKKCGRLFKRNNGKWQCYPLADWKTHHIWQYIREHNLDYNKAYDVMSRIGVPLERQRIAEFEIDSVMGFGTLAILQRGWPDLFNRYQAIKPNVRNYV